MIRFRSAAALAGAASLALVVSACGSGGGGGSKGGDGDNLIIGTTESVTAVDPAGSYDFGSWELQYQIFQQLMSIPAGGDTPEPNAADCKQDDPKKITCTLVEGLKFSNGNDLTSSDVKFSMERNIAINDPNGSAVLLGSISDGDEKAPKLADGAVETPDDTTVVFNLNKADLTFMKVLTTATASIVDEETYPADKLLADDKSVGSGPFTLAQYKPKEQAVFEANDKYTGDNKAKTKRIFLKFFGSNGPLKTAIENGSVNVAWRTLSPTDLNDLGKKDSVEVVNGKGSEFRYWVWQLGTPVGKDKAIRQAVANIVDRDAIAQNAYDGIVTPSYSIVPQGFAGQKDSFKERYPAPDVDKAAKLLEGAGVKTPVDLTLGYTPTHYGPNAVEEANELKSQLEASKLFTVKTESAEWEQYQTNYKKNAYDLFILGWYPDFLDSDNYLTPFLRDGGFYANNYKNEKVNSLLDQELAETDEAKRNEMLGELQDITAEDVPLIPSWNGKNTAVTDKTVAGVEETLDPTYIFRLWGLSKK